MRSTIVLFLVVLTLPVFAQQNLRSINPTSVTLLNLSESEAKKFNDNLKAVQPIYDKLNSGETTLEQLSPEEQELYNNSNDSKDDYWQTEENGCSWYCGGGPSKVTASSALKPQGENDYSAARAHDFSYKTAWVEGVPGYGIGQFLEYEFGAESPRVNQIIVVNGYVKSAAAWENNSRVKKLRMYVNDKPVAILNLEDKRAEQTFMIDPVGNGVRDDYEAMKKLPAWKLKFEILEVYIGSKYDDVAITELYFDGLDVHCLAKGTQISMADGTTKNIEEIVKGDRILTFDEAQKQFAQAIVEGTASAPHHNLVCYTFEDGRSVVATQDHPFMVSGKGWASLNPVGSRQYDGYDRIAMIAIHDEFPLQSPEGKISYARLVSIENLRGHYDTYTITKLDKGNNFIANGMVVGTETMVAMNGF